MFTPNEEHLRHSGTILHYIQRQDDGMEYAYIILGIPGPTGKTWLCDKLNACDYRAIELSEYIFDFVDYTSDCNYFRIIEESKCVVIILNEKLK